MADGMSSSSGYLRYLPPNFCIVYLVYGDLHRATLQTLMGYGTVETKLLGKIVAQFIRKYLPNIDEETVDVDRIVEMINEKIARFDQKVTKYEYGLNKKDFYVFHTTAATSMSKMQNSYKENELDFFKALLANITESEDLKITPRDALNLSSGLPEKINKLRAQNLLDIWIENHYFYKHTDSNIYLGAKTLTEFKEHLQQKELNNLRSCILCECIAIWGPCCDECKVIFHASCLKIYRARTDKCPSCGAKFPDAAADD